MSYTPEEIALLSTYGYAPRTQYFFDLSGVRCKSRNDIINMQRQWDAFERVENYNERIYIQFIQGYRDKQWYQYHDYRERNDYTLGQDQHIQRYPWLPAITFDSISNRPIPDDVTILTNPPSYWQPCKTVTAPTPISQEEITKQQAELAFYVHVSTFNAAHVYKYSFITMDEQLSYHRAEKRVLFPTR